MAIIGKNIYLLASVVTLLAAFNTVSSGLLGHNLVNLINDNTLKSKELKYIIYMLILMCILILALNTEFYYPQYGETVFPHTLIAEPTRENDGKYVSIMLTQSNNDPDAVKVAYWAELPEGSTEYDQFANSGVANVNNRSATIMLKCPQEKKVNKFGLKMTESRHIHYRFVFGNGKMSSVRTYYVKC